MKYTITVSVTMSAEDSYGPPTRVGYSQTEMQVEVDSFEQFGALLAEYQAISTRAGKTLSQWAQQHRG